LPAGPHIFISYARADRTQAEALRTTLVAAGHPCWLDTRDIQGGRDWLKAIEAAIHGCYALVSLVSAAANESKYVKAEFLEAEEQHKPLFPVLIEGQVRLPFYLKVHHCLDLMTDFTVGVQRLLQDLPPCPERTAVERIDSRRQQELTHLRTLRLTEQLNRPDLFISTEAVSRTSGVHRVHSAAHLFMRPEMRHIRYRGGNTESTEPEQEQRFEDILETFPRIRRAVLLGVPGAGKTTTLWKLVRDHVSAALDDSVRPLPVYVHLGEWREITQNLEAFLVAQTPSLGEALEFLIEQQQVFLLLDGLNEIPVDQRAFKSQLLAEFIVRHPSLPLVVTCRDLDYSGELRLPLDSIHIEPLTPIRIREFLYRYMEALYSGDKETAHHQAERLFWDIGGGEAVRDIWETWKAAGERDEPHPFFLTPVTPDIGQFWGAASNPKMAPPFLTSMSNAQRRTWHEIVNTPYNLMRLAANPYMLAMLMETYLKTGGQIPNNRAGLFQEFVGVLLTREGLADRESLHATPTGERLLQVMGKIAWTMQTAEDRVTSRRGPQTTLVVSDAAPYLDPEHRRLAVAASLLAAGDSIRFNHQLLQEYFVALGMRDQMESGTLQPEVIWPTQSWWETSGWEEAAVLLAGLYPDDGTPVLDWLGEAQPEVAAACINRSGSTVPEARLEQLGRHWLDRLTGPQADPHPYARAAIGRALGSVSYKGRMLDRRPGVGLDEGGLPDIEWCPVGETGQPDFYIARYLVTHAQFQAFIDAPDGYRNPDWWTGMPEDARDGPKASRWAEPNHPRETVSWYESLAFCRWLTARNVVAREGWEVSLPTDAEWRRAYVGDTRLAYPWGEKYLSGYANINESHDIETGFYLARTSAVGLYPQGAGMSGSEDMAGNVWEWCLNKRDALDHTEIDATKDPRVLRGGSWRFETEYLRSVDRYRYYPVYRGGNIGFRVVCRPPSSFGY